MFTKHIPSLDCLVNSGRNINNPFGEKNLSHPHFYILPNKLQDWFFFNLNFQENFYGFYSNARNLKRKE